MSKIWGYKLANEHAPSLLRELRALTRDGSQEWLMYSRSLFRFKCMSRPNCTVAYVGSDAMVQGGKSSLANRPQGGRAILERLLEVNSASLMMTS